MTITSDIVEAFLKCPTKCYLRSLGEVGTGNAYAEWVRTQNELWRREGIKRLMAGTAPDECVGSLTVTTNLKTAKWRLAIEYVVRSRNMESDLHAVERIPSEGRGKPPQFIPIRFVSTNKLNRDDKLRRRNGSTSTERAFLPSPNSPTRSGHAEGQSDWLASAKSISTR